MKPIIAENNEMIVTLTPTTHSEIDGFNSYEIDVKIKRKLAVSPNLQQYSVFTHLQAELRMVLDRAFKEKTTFKVIE